MRKSFLSLTIVLAAAEPARAGAFEEAAIRARSNFVRALGGFRLPPLLLKQGGPAQGAKAAAAADLAALAQAGARFRYDPAAGLCLDSLGQAGMNRVSLQELQKGKDGECADLGDIRLNGDDLSYPKLTGWNLRGADMRKARLHFAHLLEADLRGALMQGFDFGYAKVTGTLDRFTRPPQDGCAVKESTRLECYR